MENTIKFTQEEMQEIANLQRKYQEKIFQLGQVKFDEASIKEATERLKEKEKSLFDEWKDIQQEEQDILKKLADKYGDGSLNLKDGTFTPQTSDDVNQSETVTNSPQEFTVPSFNQTP